MRVDIWEFTVLPLYHQTVMLARQWLKWCVFVLVEVSSLDDSSVALFHVRGCLFGVLSTYQPCGDLPMAHPTSCPVCAEIGNPVQDQHVLE